MFYAIVRPFSYPGLGQRICEGIDIKFLCNKLPAVLCFAPKHTSHIICYYAVLSESTAKRDRGVKFEDFALNDVGEYWLVDAEARSVEQYVLHDDNYKLVMKSGTGRLESSVINDFKIDLESFFDERKNMEALLRIIAN